MKDLLLFFSCLLLPCLDEIGWVNFLPGEQDWSRGVALLCFLKHTPVATPASV